MLSMLARLKPYTPAVVATLTLVLIQALAELGLPTLMAGIIDKGVLGNRPEAIATGGLWMLAAALAGALASVAASVVSARLGAGFGRDLRAQVFRKTTGLSVEGFASFGAASLITRTTNDVTQVQSFVVMSLRMLAMAPLMAVGGLVMAFSLDAELALVLAVSVPLLVVGMVLLASRAVRLFRLVQKKIDRLNLVLRESLTGVRVIRAFDRQSFDSQRFEAANVDLADISLKTQKLMAVVMPGMMLIMSVTSVALVWFGGLQIVVGSLAVGGLMAFLQYATQILFSLMMMSMLFVLLPRAAVSAARIDEVLRAPDAVGGEGGGRVVPPHPAGAAIEFRGVSFRYPGAEQAALQDVSFAVEPGSFTALIGGTGSGKSTILQLIARFHEVTEGQVLVDGLDVREWDVVSLRLRLGISPQRARLFMGTVAENLRWGDPLADDATLDRALQMAQAREFVDALPEGLNSMIDKAGANLSGGQRQRLAMARMLVREPAALLFDDSFSALDFKTDAALRAALRHRPTPSTIVVVAQRLATVRDADRIVVLEEGTVADVGTHTDLLNRSTVYQEIAASQEGQGVQG